ncbi:heterokaryon incompatibility protein [Colletotrichum plurivorum]|uniref:Heterokaryon incompatibility protein n=1 Tax=Colletotrichum plurivorum TaxID=2175906 RepID=A0A8H6JKJ4_9PEZI|nr:heterokaryon incompatibility protein [Colletotrichum plurivorum]
MSRWHEPSCSRPQVQVLGGLPCCTSCFAVASLDDNEPELPLQCTWKPPTEESGTFNLSWPACVEYFRSEDSRENVGAGAEFSKLKRKASTVLERSQTDSDKKSNPGHEEGSTNVDSSANRGFQYQSLSNRNEIRLLELYPGDEGSPLHADFTTTNLESNYTAYDALSYTWADETGNTDRCRPLFVGPFWDRMPITRNCEQALGSVRRRAETSAWMPVEIPRKIWVDSVCINQIDADERSSQVALMGKIYSTATEVLVYLGAAKNNSAAALVAITKSLLQQGCGHAKPSSEDACGDCSDAIQLLLRRPYFRRLWVVQEVVLSKRLSIHCGSSSALWPHDALTERLRFASWARHREGGGGLQDDADSARELLSFLLDTSECLCQDPRDKVFALLGLVRNWDGPPITANYELSVRAVWTGIAAYLITKGRHQEVLMLAGTCRDRRPGLPSWVPDIGQLPSVDEWFNTAGIHANRDPGWRNLTHSSLFSLSTDTFDTEDSACRLPFMAQASPRVKIHSRQASLHVSAVRICKVNERFPLQPNEKNSTQLLEVITDIKTKPPLRSMVLLPNYYSPSTRSMVDVDFQFSEEDCIYWLHEMECYVTLRPGSQPTTFTMVCACDLMISNGRMGYYVNNGFYIRPLTAGEDSRLSSEWNRILSKIETEVGAMFISALAARPGRARAQLLDVAYSLSPVSDSIDGTALREFWNHQKMAEDLWSIWKEYESRLRPLLADASGRRTIIRAFRESTVESCWHCTQIITISGTIGNGGCVHGFVHVSKLLWSLLHTSDGRGSYLAKSDRPSGDDLLGSLKGWAYITEDLLLRLQLSEAHATVDLVRQMPGEGLNDLWSSRWEHFMEDVFPILGVSDVDSIDAIESILDLYPTNEDEASDGAHASVQEPTREEFRRRLTDESCWYWDDVRSKLDARWKVWKVLDADKWIRKWGRTQENTVTGFSDLEKQLAMRLEARRHGFNVDNAEDVMIL